MDPVSLLWLIFGVTVVVVCALDLFVITHRHSPVGVASALRWMAATASRMLAMVSRRAFPMVTSSSRPSGMSGVVRRPSAASFSTATMRRTPAVTANTMPRKR